MKSDQVSIFVEVKYDRLAFDDADLYSLSKSLAAVGPVRKRDAYVERGGTEVCLWITLQFIGVSALQAIIGAITLSVLKNMHQRIYAFLNEKRATQSDYAAAIALCLSFDDKEIEVNLPLDTKPEFLQSLLLKVAEHLQIYPLSEMPIGKIWIPLTQEGEMWSESFFWETAGFLDRYWGIANYNHSRITDIYDSDTRELINACDKIL